MNMNSMAKIRIGDNTTADEVRRQLSDFSWFSKVEASTEEVDGKKIVVLHEVTLGKRLIRLFQSPAQRSDHADKSRHAMRAMANKHPAIRALMGSSINNKSGWTVSELRQALTAGLVRLAPTENAKKLVVPLSKLGQVGVAHAKVADIGSDSKVIWGMKQANLPHPTTVSMSSDERPFVAVTVYHPSEPGIEEMKAAYRDALKAASGHVVIAPIKDGALGDLQPCSALSLDLLLEAIDEAKEKNPNLTAVTIAAREIDDKGLAGRIEDMQAQRNFGAVSFNRRKEQGRFHLPYDRLVPGDAGIHFLTNSPFNLQANRTIVPSSVADSKGYEYFPEVLVEELPNVDTGRLIAFDDSDLDRLFRFYPEKIKQRFGLLLANMVGTVVIYPPSAVDDQLKAMMSAVLDACEKNPQLSVSFAAPDQSQQAQLTRAYRKAQEERRENTLESDDDDTEITVADLWKTV
jgi:hypothetical protein